MVLKAQKSGMAFLALMLGVASPAFAADAVTPADLHAIANAMGFLGGLPHGAPLTMGILFGSDSKQAVQTAQALEQIPGPAQSSFKTVLIPAADLARNQSHLDALLMMPDTMSQAAAVAEVARRRKLVTIATDPACLEQQACVLMVRADGRVRIVLDTRLAGAVGADFSSVFMMMVERR